MQQGREQESAGNSMIDILTLNYNDAETTKRFIAHHKDVDCVRRLLVVDNCSTDDSIEQLMPYTDTKVELIRSDRNGGYGYGNNFGLRHLAKQGGERFVLIANPDTVVSGETLRTLEQFLSNHPNYAVASPFMCDSEGNRCANTAWRIPTKYGFIFGESLLFSRLRSAVRYTDIFDLSVSVRDVDVVTGSLLMVDREKMLCVGPYDENMFLYGEELALGLRLKAAGHQTALLPREIFLHQHAASTSKAFPSVISREKMALESEGYILRKYYGMKGFSAVLFGVMCRVRCAEIFLWLHIRPYMKRGKKNRKGT